MIKEKYVSKIEETSISVMDTNIESIRRKDIIKTGLRVYKDGLVGASGAIGGFDEKELENQALESLKNNIPYPYEISGNKKLTINHTTKIIEDDKLVNEFDEVLKQLRKEQPSFIFSNKINMTKYEYMLQNDKGLDLQYRDKALEITLLFKEKSSINIFDGAVVLSGRKYDRSEFLKEANVICNAFKTPVELPNKQRLPVIFPIGDQSPLDLPLLKFATDLNGNAFGSKRSMFSSSLGKQIFNENFTLFQTHNPEDYITPFFDAEGVVNDDFRYTLIENGRLISPYTDKKASKLYNLPLTGSSVGEYDDIPKLGAPKFKIKDSRKSIKELLNGEMGILIMFAMGGDFTHDGSFATPVQLAFLFDGEKLIGRLPQLVISTNIFEMYGNAFIGSTRDSLSPLSGLDSLIMNLKVSKL